LSHDVESVAKDKERVVRVDDRALRHGPPMIGSVRLPHPELAARPVERRPATRTQSCARGRARWQCD
jgi:hypothetical protein